ncbi:flavin reductase family protein [Bradyrhizobium sp. LHD-71]|uniref:flavin reductase family protein n=1 Tax=Bradyrhizobium sp. LHD-71 TaxID=3072141 RepID=UPI00280E9230|nr:flavin reductase family protein [Bradyrhizobium sp. LHD-71]MDQ8730983.1 flavin reductase family protein [Bradyrhizobium sp. LHD-71]
MDQITDAKTFWRALGSRAIGVAVVTASGSSGPAGFLALSATHLTANPPTMLVSIGQSTSALAPILESKHFAINYIGKSREDLAKEFGGQGTRKGADRFLPGEWNTLKTGAPALIGAVGVLDCELEEAIERHGTTIAIGRIVAFTQAPDVQPLISFAGKYI